MPSDPPSENVSEAESEAGSDEEPEVLSLLEEDEGGLEDLLLSEDGKNIPDLLKMLVKATSNIGKHLQNQNNILTVIAKGLK